MKETAIVLYPLAPRCVVNTLLDVTSCDFFIPETTLTNLCSDAKLFTSQNHTLEVGVES